MTTPRHLVHEHPELPREGGPPSIPHGASMGVIPDEIEVTVTMPLASFLWTWGWAEHKVIESYRWYGDKKDIDEATVAAVQALRDAVTPELQERFDELVKEARDEARQQRLSKNTTRRKVRTS